MKGTQLFAIFIIAFMAFSTIAFVLSATFDQSSAPGAQDNTQATATKITYTAQVDANVLEVFPSFKLVAETEEFDISRIDSAVAQADGITGVKSVFRQSQQQTSGSAVTYYVADVSFDAKKTDFGIVTSAIGENTAGFLQGFGFFPNALIVVPAKIVLENSDLNLAKDYEFKDNVIQSYLNAGTLKGDKILARIEISFSGEQPVSTLSSESQNYSQETKQHSVSLALPLVSIQPKLTFSADANYSGRIDVNALEQLLLKMRDVNAVEQLSAEPAYYNFLLTVKQPFSSTLEQDLNSLLPSISGVTGTQFFSDANALNVVIGFQENADIAPLKQNISRALSDLNIGAQGISFTEPTVSYSGNIVLSTTDAKGAAEAVSTFFISKNFSAKVYQAAYLQVSSLADQDTKETFAVDSNSVEAAIFPVHKIGDTIFASVVFYSQRGKLLDAKAIELVNPVRIS